MVRSQYYWVKIKVSVGLCSLWRSWGKIFSLFLSAFGRYQHFLACGCITAVLKARIFKSLCILSLHCFLPSVCKIFLPPFSYGLGQLVNIDDLWYSSIQLLKPLLPMVSEMALDWSFFPTALNKVFLNFVWFLLWQWFHTLTITFWSFLNKTLKINVNVILILKEIIK